MGNAEKLLDVKPTLLAPTAGRILISVPFYNDPFFNRTVVMLTDYDEKGAAGLILGPAAALILKSLVSPREREERKNMENEVDHS